MLTLSYLDNTMSWGDKDNPMSWGDKDNTMSWGAPEAERDLDYITQLFY